MGGGLARDGWWSPERDRWIFFGFFTIGVVFILVLKTAVGNQIVVTVLPCLFMLFYAGLQWDIGAWEPRPHANGDNLYYLGFLYTLTSLGHALYRFSTDQEDTEVIVTNFGIAISTTILGMALRILLGRPGLDDPPVVETSARRDLASAARKLRAELEYSAADFQGFREELEQDFRNFRERLAQDVDLAHAAVSKTLDRALGLERAIESFEIGTRKAVETIVDRARELERSAAALTAFEGAVDRLDTRTTAAVEAIGGHSTALAAGAASVGESLRSQVDGLRGVDFGQALIDLAGPASARLQAAVERSAARIDTRIDSLFEDAERRAKELEAGAGAVREALRLQAERIAALDFPKAFSDAVQPASADLRAAAGEFRELLDRLRQADAVRDQVRAAHERAVATANEVLREQATLVTAVAAAANDSRRAAESIRSAGERLSGLNQGAEDAARQVAAVRDEFARSAERLQAVNEELAQVSGALATWVGEARDALGRRPRRRWFARRGG